nr:MAG TPA: hypothetical protein [Caudoviricetes sp.]
MFLCYNIIKERERRNSLWLNLLLFCPIPTTWA